ncbi:MAG: Gldg family protein [Gammaproteobacteria bacterium]|nr:Gldg family protein [Gammaproteobacteria bacterium]
MSKLISALANTDRNVIGLITGVSMTGQFNPQLQRMEQPWVVYQQASQLFEIRDLTTSFDAVPDDVSLLWIVQPKDLPTETQYAIDQFVMRGGKALIFVDPMAAADAAASDGMPQGMPPMGQGSDLPSLFDGWGIEFTAQEVVADAQLALPLNSGMGGRPVRHYGYLGITRELMNADDIITMELTTVNAAMAGTLGVADDSELTLEPLLTSSRASTTMPASRFAFLPDPATLQDGFVAGDEPQIIAARISGTIPSAFPDGKPAGDDDEAEADDNATHEHLAQSAETANLIVVTDVDILSDPLWVQVQSFFGQQIANAFASNGAFVINALENLAGSSDLIAVRSRASFARPFTRVDELRVDAEARFRATEQRLQEDLAETERRLAELQSTREDSGSLLLTDEQQAEIDRFVDQRASIRTELRAVQRGLDQDIEDLGALLRIINIGLVPVLLTAGSLIAVWRRGRRRQS